jgi:hypothetical protein
MDVNVPVSGAVSTLTAVVAMVLPSPLLIAAALMRACIAQFTGEPWIAPLYDSVVVIVCPMIPEPISMDATWLPGALADSSLRNVSVTSTVMGTFTTLLVPLPVVITLSVPV